MKRATGTVLITLGRLPKALDLARSFHDLGYRVIIAEPFRWHLTGLSSAVAKRYQVTAPSTNRIRYLEDLHDIVVRERVNLIVPVSEEIIHASFLRERLPPGVSIYAMRPEVLLALHDKQSFIDRCRQFALSAPTTALLGEDGGKAIAQAMDYIVKPVYSCSGRGVLFRHKGAALPDLSAQPMIVQQWLKGSVLSTFSIARSGVAGNTVVYRGAVMSGTVAVCFERVAESDPHHQPVVAWVKRFVEAARFDGFISFDLVVDDEGKAHGIECNPRATSGLHFVDPRDLALCVLDRQSSTTMRFRPERLMQQFYPCLTELQKSMFRGNFRLNLSRFLRARDVTWHWRDPLPFLTMPFTAWQIIWLSIRRGTSFGEVATLDVGWYEANLSSKPDEQWKVAD